MSNKASFSRRTLTAAIGFAIAAQAAAQDSSTPDEIVVVGSRASLASAIQKQRNANSVVGVVDSDAIGNFADINVAESLRRISGIMVENDQGEGRYVSVRGLNTDLNAMTINGVSTAAPEDRRGIILDGVPSDLLESMTVYKSLIPNLDADSLGGAIDLETITAFSYDELFVRVKAESSYNELTEDSSNPELSATFANRWRLDNGEFGVAVVVSDQTRRIIGHNNENGGWSETAPNDDYEMRFYDLERDREGLIVNLDYRTDSGNSFYAHFFRNEYTDTEWRAKWETRDGLEDNEPTVSGQVFSYADSKVDTESRNRTEVREITSMQLGTSLQLNDRNRVDIEFFSSEAEQDDRDRQAAIFRSGTVDSPIIYDNSNPRRPVVSFPAEFYNPSLFGLKAWEKEGALNTDEDVGARIDLYHEFSLNTELQAGVKLRLREKDNSFNFCGYEPVDDVLLSDVAFTTPDQFLNSVAGPTATFSQAKAFFNNLGTGTVPLSDGTTCFNPGSFFEFSGDEEEESIPADWNTEEDVLAGYVMATTDLDNSTWVYGLRYEDTRSTYTGKNFDGDGFAGLSSFDNDYGFLAPSLNVKYNLTDNQIVRFGMFRSLIRPGFQESSAGAIIDTEDNEIEGGNPDLDPTTAWNLDLTYEFYAGLETFFGAGIFYKDIRDPIIEVESTDAFLRDRTWDVAGTFVNANDSDIYGFELSFQTVLENGFLFVANYTYSDGETDLPSDSVNGQRTIPFFKQAKHTGNLSVGYDQGPWDVRLAANYRSEYLDEIGDEAVFDRYTDDHMQLDLTIRYAFNDNLTITGEAINLNDRPEYYYFGNRNRLSQYDEYGTTYGLGFRYNF